MKLSLQKKWHIKEANPSSSKRLPLSLNSYEKMPVPDQYHSVTSQSNDLQGVCSSRPSKKKQSNPSSIKQIRPPSAEISYRNLNSLSPNPLTISSKIKSKPTIYNLMTSPKIKVKPQNNFSLTQKGFMISNYNNKISTKVKSTNDIDPQLDKAEQSSKSTQCINESNKSIQQLNETSLTIKAENPENCSKNVPFISPVNNMMRRLTLNEKERFFSTSITSSGSKPANKENNRENVNREREIYNKERENLNFKKENKESLDSEKKKISLRSFSQNPRIAQAIEVKEQSKTPIANNLIQGSPKRNENPLQKITNIVKELNDLDKDGGDYDLLRTCVLELEEKITDLKSSIELKRPPQSFKKSGNTFFMNNENKENKQSFVSVHAVPMENPLNNMVTSARPLVKPDTNENSNNNGKISIIQVQSLFNNNQNKHQYPKSTTNAELQKKKFEFQNKPKSIKIENINPQEELIPEEPQIVNNLNNVLVMHSPRMNIITNYIMNENYNKVYYISNAVNSFYKPLNTYEDSCEDNYFTQLCQEHMMQTFQSLHLSRNLFNNLENHSFENKSFEISKKESHKYKKTLIFDLDETLVHCNESLELPADVILPIMFPNGQKIEVGINIRPYTRECLKELSQYYEIIVFTASHSCYANVVLDYLDEKKEFIHHRMYREHCISTKEGVFIKDLRVIKNRELENMIIVDNAAYSFAFQLNNGIPILPYYDFKADKELLHLKEYLKELAEVDDIREVNKNTFKLQEYEKYEEIQGLIENELKNYIFC